METFKGIKSEAILRMGRENEGDKMFVQNKKTITSGGINRFVNAINWMCVERDAMQWQCL